MRFTSNRRCGVRGSATRGRRSSRLRRCALETPRASATSSTLMPPKNRSSTTFAWRGSMAPRRSRASSRASTSSSFWGRERRLHRGRRGPARRRAYRAAASGHGRQEFVAWPVRRPRKSVTSRASRRGFGRRVSCTLRGRGRWAGGCGCAVPARGNGGRGAKFVIHQGQQLIRGALIPVAHLLQHLCDIFPKLAHAKFPS